MTPLITLVIRLDFLGLPLAPHPLLSIFLRLPIHLILNLTPLCRPLLLQLNLQPFEFLTLRVHPDQALQELDLVGPHLLVLDGLAIGAFLVDGCFEDHWLALEGGMVHDAVEGTQAEKPGSNVGVEVAVGGEGGFAVVY